MPCVARDCRGWIKPFANLSMTKPPMIAPQPPADTTPPDAVTSPSTQSETPASPWRHTLILSQADGVDEAFAVAPDGYVWHYTMGADRAGGGRLMSTGLRTDVFGAATLPDGRRLVMGGEGRDLVYCVESYARPGSWEPPRRTILTAGHPVGPIESICLRATQGEIWIHVVTVANGQTGERDLWLGTWHDNQPSFGDRPTRTSSALEIAWSQLPEGGQRRAH